VTPEELRSWRKRNGFSQGKLAKVLGVAPQTVHRWETGRREIPSFLHLALECVEKRGGETGIKGTETRKERR